ncbi:GNAT family N-acetyltransferase [Spirulina sp. CS-785/01]|uniref:GNAT family N-acetyltransferase n=1 Tax=Spirulina sp. CS-785/01 TaxID=3021716 RepID=UPI00232E2442|nr:GNAT family N-acetyltransferase [Spirulina sp. CS-785/01]MDB9314797.1 GNAT family N-acetyltransferase [Spirulina sp. CS-785/01]
MLTIIAETPRLQLRHFTIADLPDLAMILADPKVMEFSLKGAMNTAESQGFLKSRILASYRENGFGLYAVEEKAQGRLIGFCGLLAQTLGEQKEVELAYRLAYPYWGRGLATESAIAIRDYTFHTLKIPRLISIIAPDNRRSIRVAEKVGLQRETKTVFQGFPVSIYALSHATEANHPKQAELLG